MLYRVSKYFLLNLKTAIYLIWNYKTLYGIIKRPIHVLFVTCFVYFKSRFSYFTFDSYLFAFRFLERQRNLDSLIGRKFQKGAVKN